MSYFEDREKDLYNEMVMLLKSNDFYAMPRQFRNNALDITEIDKLPKARVEFGRYDVKWDLTELQPITSIKEPNQYLFGLLTFEFNTSDFKKDIIYIDNYIIYAKSKLKNDEVKELTEEHIFSQFVRKEPIIKSEYKFNLHPFNGRYGK